MKFPDYDTRKKIMMDFLHRKGYHGEYTNNIDLATKHILDFLKDAYHTYVSLTNQTNQMNLSLINHFESLINNIEKLYSPQKKGLEEMIRNEHTMSEDYQALNIINNHIKIRYSTWTTIL